MTDLSYQPYETIATSRRYVLGEVSEGDWEGYGIWDRLAGNRIVERFPPTEEGIELGFQRFNELKWKDRGERWNLARVARIATVAGVALWVVAGTLAIVLLLVRGRPRPALVRARRIRLPGGRGIAARSGRTGVAPMDAARRDPSPFPPGFP
jgi:hypothetical protein